MPTYRFECKDCSSRFEEFLTIKESESPRPCQSCQSSNTFKLMFAPNFNLVGDDWTGKNIRIKGQMMKRRQEATERQNEFKRDSGKIPTLAPNVGGERVESWADAQKLAKDQGRVASTYDPLVRKEAQK